MTIVINSLRQRKKTEARRRIISAAVELFSAEGFDAVTVDRIAAAADVGKGTVYNYFAAKDDIVVAFMAAMEESVQATATRLAASHEPLAVILASFVLSQLRSKRRHHAFVRVFLARMFGQTNEFLPYMVEMQKSIDPPLEQLFRRLQARGVMRRDIPLEDLVLAFKTVQTGLTALWAIEGPPFKTSERMVRLHMKLLCQGLETKV